MKLNGVNKLFIAIAIGLIGLHVYQVFHYRAWDRYYYFTNICTPPGHPAYVRDAYFLTANNGEFSSIRYDESNHFQTVWKESYYFPETYEKQLLPEKLVLKYVSYRDRQFYRDTINLPVDTIKRLTDQILTERKATDIYCRGRDVQGVTFLVGIANNGYILVWLKGEGIEHLVVRTRIQPAIPTKEDTYYDGEVMTVGAYINNRFMTLEDSVKAKIHAGWETNANYKDSL